MTPKAKYYETLANTMIKNFEKRRMEAYYYPTAKEAVEKALSFLPSGAVVAHGGSMTLEETGMMDALRSAVLIDSGKNDGDLFFLRHFAKCSQIMNTCGVDERNFTHTDDAYIRTVSQLRHRFFELRSDTEEVRAVDLIYLYAFRDDEVLFVHGNVRFFVRVNLVGDDRDFGCLHYAFHKENAGNN